MAYHPPALTTLVLRLPFAPVPTVTTYRQPNFSIQTLPVGLPAPLSSGERYRLPHSCHASFYLLRQTAYRYLRRKKKKKSDGWMDADGEGW